MKNGDIKLVQKMHDYGYPDPGHYEYYLVKMVKRKNKWIQLLFGDKELILELYGHIKPTQEQVEKDILIHGNK